ncbi:transposase [Pseudomonas sp. o96-267]|uniref:REP-associated tyrosine transposase n=1 Tax=Pseudomonas sp. o96-267 TaxID=2479853 RepID=UPI000F781C0D|nr:transposase [Pseudomonas sp. o96-267]RRV28174.1 transposase [Pseudomonas sp. o96-267]
MPNYRRIWCPAGTYFFTHALRVRHGNDLLVRHIDVLREAVRIVRRSHPFQIHGWVVLPDHLHCLIELPQGEADFALCWRLIKMIFSRDVPAEEWRSKILLRRRERGIWQRRYWEHLIRDDEDFCRHLDYIHINPLKHGLVQRVSDWPYSTFHRDAESGRYPLDWAGGAEMDDSLYDD